MNIAFTQEGFRALRVAWIVLALSVAASAGAALSSYWYLQKERRDDISSRRQLQETRARVDAARRERDDLKASSELFRDLMARGILKDEARLDFIERLERLKDRHHLLGLEYEISPQRPLQLAGGRVYNAIDVLGSRVKVRALALHEGDALAFLEELARPAQGFTPLSRCAMRRVEVGEPTAVAPRAEAECTLEWISLKAKGGNRAY